MLDRIRIVLVNTSHPGNIGAAARAMKTMGLSTLYLVNPRDFPCHKADEMASGACDILVNARVVTGLDEAISGCHLVIGSSARSRTVPWPLLTPREMAEKVSQEPSGSPIAILFGCEQSGLSNEELKRCHWHTQIPANPDYSSLNLAAAVQVMAYELRMMSLTNVTTAIPWTHPKASADEMEKFFVHLQEALVAVDFLKLTAPKKLMMRLRRLFFRARPDVREMNILRGMLTAILASRHPERSEGSHLT